MIRQCSIRFAALAAVTAALSGCALYSDVSVRPFAVLPSYINRGAGVEQSLRRNDILGALAQGAALSSNPKTTAADLAAFGAALLASGRYDDARRQLRASLELKPSRDEYADAAWSLSQVEYMQNNYAASLEWAKAAQSRGLAVRQWHLDYVDALSSVDPYRFTAAATVTLPMTMGKPDVPRLEARVNDQGVTAFIDSGAVLSIVSRQLADRVPIRRLGNVRGDFFGLLGEPISVEFGLIERLQLGAMIVENVPVAVMPSEKMRFSAGEKAHVAMEMLLGANILKEFRTELDFRRGQVTFARLTPDDRVIDRRQNLFISGFRPYVHGLVQRRGWHLMLLDTGSEVTFLNGSQTPLARSSGMHAAKMQGLGGAMKSGQKLDDIELVIDGWSGMFRTLPMYSGSDQERAAGILGQNFLKKFRVVIDYGRMRVDLQRD